MRVNPFLVKDDLINKTKYAHTLIQMLYLVLTNAILAFEVVRREQSAERFPIASLTSVCAENGNCKKAERETKRKKKIENSREKDSFVAKVGVCRDVSARSHR